MSDIHDYRKEIDGIDEQLVSLFLRRMELSCKVAEYKKREGKPIFDPARERELLTKIADLAGEEYQADAETLYSIILELSKSRQGRMIYPRSAAREQVEKEIAAPPKMFPTRATVACQGVEGAYSVNAAEKLFAHPEIKLYRSFSEVFDAVSSGACRYGVLPVENSTAGSVREVYDLMQERRFFIVRSVRLRVDHCLLTLRDVKKEEIKEVISHEQALRQCENYLKSLPGGVKATAVSNTAAAARTVAESGRRDLAALSSASCGMLYGLSVLEEAVQDCGSNYTRFICISKEHEIYPGADRTTILAVIPHKPGSLYRILSRFYTLGMDLTKLESSPLRGRDFLFRFCFDLQSSVYDPRLLLLLDDLENSLSEFRYLGSYQEIV